MKCEKCGFIPNPGDQICIKCGAKLSLVNAVMPEIEEVSIEQEKRVNKKFIIGVIAGIVILILIVFLIIKLIVLKV